jgi:hypothetical protein
MPTYLQDTPLVPCPSCGCPVIAGATPEAVHVQFHVASGAVRAGDDCPLCGRLGEMYLPAAVRGSQGYPWAAPGSQLPVGTVAWSCGHSAVVR